MMMLGKKISISISLSLPPLRNVRGVVGRYSFSHDGPSSVPSDSDPPANIPPEIQSVPANESSFYPSADVLGTNNANLQSWKQQIIPDPVSQMPPNGSGPDFPGPPIPSPPCPDMPEPVPPPRPSPDFVPPKPPENVPPPPPPPPPQPDLPVDPDINPPTGPFS